MKNTQEGDTSTDKENFPMGTLLAFLAGFAAMLGSRAAAVLWDQASEKMGTDKDEQ